MQLRRQLQRHAAAALARHRRTRPVAGQIDLNFGQAATYIGAVRNGQLKAMAMLSRERWWAAPEIPNMDEAGVPGFYFSFWHGMWLPKGTPPDIVAKVNAAVVSALALHLVVLVNALVLGGVAMLHWPGDKPAV